MAQRRIPDFPKISHYNTWQIDKLQILVEKNHGYLVFPSWVNASDFQDTDESCVTVAIHSEALDAKLQSQMGKIDSSVAQDLVGDLKFLCQQQGVMIPFLPVHGKNECQLFTQLVLHDLERFDEHILALKWIDFVDGRMIFPKLPHQLRKYYKQWEQNQRVQAAVQHMKSDQEILDLINKNQIPVEILESQMI